MARNRVPVQKAQVSGAAIKDPQRFRDRTSSKQKRPIGDPYLKMSDAEKEYWSEFSQELPWLNSSQRILLRLACVWSAKMDEGDFGVSATQALSSILSKLGATPTDETKVNHGDDGESDPADQFFNKPH